MPVLRRRTILARLHRRETPRGRLQGRAQLHRHRAGDRGALVRPDLREFERLRPLAVPRRRRPEMVRQHGLGPPLGRPSAQSEEPALRRNPAAGIRRRLRQARRPGGKHLSRQRPRAGRGATSLQAQRLVLSDRRRGRHGLRPCGYDGPLARHSRPVRASPQRACDHVEGRARGGAAARRSRADRRDAGRSRLPHASLLAPAEGFSALAARTRDGAAAMRLGRGRLALSGARRSYARRRRPRSSRKRGAAEADDAARRVFLHAIAARISMAADAVSRTHLFALGAAGMAAAHRARVRSARGSNRPSSRAGRNTSPSGRRPSSIFDRRHSSRRLGSPPTTTGTSFTFSRRPSTRAWAAC